jgi:hypothetical protein
MFKFIEVITSYPMTRTGFAFTDTVSGHSVHHFTDRHGKSWLAEHRMAWFRVKKV